MPHILDEEGLIRVARLILEKRHPTSLSGAYSMLDAQMGAYLSGTALAARVVDAYFLASKEPC